MRKAWNIQKQFVIKFPSRANKTGQDLTFNMLQDFAKSGSLFWMTTSGPQIWNRIIERQRNLPNFAVNNVPADALAPLGTRASAGRAMTHFGPSIYINGIWSLVEGESIVFELGEILFWEQSVVGTKHIITKCEL